MEPLLTVPRVTEIKDQSLSASEKRRQFSSAKSKTANESKTPSSPGRTQISASVDSNDSGVVTMYSAKSSAESQIEENDSTGLEERSGELIFENGCLVSRQTDETLQAYKQMQDEEDQRGNVIKSHLKNELWQKCLVLNISKYGYKALRRQEYPDQRTLNDIYKQFGRNDKLTLKTCDQICALVRSKDDSIVDVFAAVRDGSDSIVFVIIVNKTVRLEKLIEYSFVKRMVGDVSNEGKEVINNKEFDSFWTLTSTAGRENLRRSINSINIELMKNHRNLVMISGSPVRSKGYNSQSHTIVQETCIVLYVLIKGYIPIQENPFKKKYLGVPVDVREGSFVLFTRRANCYHDSLKSGCQIQREGLGTGTLGGFIDYQEFGTCGLTCAHVLLHEVELKNHTPTTENDMELEYPATGHIVYQPECTPGQRNAVGKVVKAIYREGGRGESGIDIAVFKVEQRLPFVGEFPSLNDESCSNMSYDSGKILDISRICPGQRVFKFGAESNLTEGLFVTEEATNSIKTFVTYEITYPFKIILHNLLEIRASDFQPRFAEPGDSGALVFCNGEDNELICVGVVEGGTTHGTCLVMPISSILEQLSVTSLKSFESNRKFEQGMKEKLDDLRNSISNEINAAEVRAIQREEQRFTYMQHTFNTQTAQSEERISQSVGSIVTQNEQRVLDFLNNFESNMNAKFQSLFAARNLNNNI